MDIKKVIRFLQEKEKRKKENLHRLRRLIIDKLKSTRVFEKYRVKKAFLFGSMVEGNITELSDVDIAIVGDLDFHEFSQLFTDIESILGFEVDLWMIDDLPFKNDILKKGMKIYERKDTDFNEQY